MITNRDIELAFVRAQNRINEGLEDAQIQFMEPDLDRLSEMLMKQLKGKSQKTVNQNNPIANEEV